MVFTAEVSEANTALSCTQGSIRSILVEISKQRSRSGLSVSVDATEMAGKEIKKQQNPCGTLCA